MVEHNLGISRLDLVVILIYIRSKEFSEENSIIIIIIIINISSNSSSISSSSNMSLLYNGLLLRTFLCLCG